MSVTNTVGAALLCEGRSVVERLRGDRDIRRADR
jgi:hypothetical protein